MLCEAPPSGLPAISLKGEIGNCSARAGLAALMIAENVAAIQSPPVGGEGRQARGE